MIVVGPEDPLVEGIYDSFTGDASTQHIAIIGPTAKGAQLEGSKEFAKGFMERHVFPPPLQKASLLLIWTKALLSSKPSKLPTC